MQPDRYESLVRAAGRVVLLVCGLIWLGGALALLLVPSCPPSSAREATGAPSVILVARPATAVFDYLPSMTSVDLMITVT
jgi:hypothetical protein